MDWDLIQKAVALAAGIFGTVNSILLRRDASRAKLPKFHLSVDKHKFATLRIENRTDSLVVVRAIRVRGILASIKVPNPGGGTLTPQEFSDPIGSVRTLRPSLGVPSG